MSRKIVYTSIFGGYDVKNIQSINGWDWKCFDESNSLTLYSDNNRNAKRFKVLPHRHLQDNEYSVFIDGNMSVVGDLDKLIDEFLSDGNVAF